MIHTKLEEMTPEVREAVRRLKHKLCAEAESYKGVRPEKCQQCESPCCHGGELLKLLGMEPQALARISDVFESVRHSRGRIAQHVINSMNRGKP